MNLLRIHTQMQPITELVSKISKCRLTFKFKYTEKAPYYTGEICSDKIKQIVFSFYIKTDKVSLQLGP